MIKINEDVSDLIFRSMFCLIFVGLGMEHIFSDELIQHLMPTWMPYPRAVSVLCGLWLTLWGGMILLGYRLKLAAICLGYFLIIVTLAVHLPAIFYTPVQIPADADWMWQILQRSNLAKNLCLLGVCFHLQNHRLGRYSLDYRRQKFF